MYYKVFLDTNIYDGANYSFRNASFSALRSRAKKGELELHINNVVEGEVRGHIKSNVKKAAKVLLEAVKQPKLAGFKNIDGFQDLISIPNPNDWVTTALNGFDELLEECECERISNNGINVDEIVADYFAQRYPFEPKKPDEFKDAITVLSIIHDTEDLEDDEIYIIISDDKGFKSKRFILG